MLMPFRVPGKQIFPSPGLAWFPRCFLARFQGYITTRDWTGHPVWHVSAPDGRLSQKGQLNPLSL